MFELDTSVIFIIYFQLKFEIMSYDIICYACWNWITVIGFPMILCYAVFGVLHTYIFFSRVCLVDCNLIKEPRSLSGAINFYFLFLYVSSQLIKLINLIKNKNNCKLICIPHLFVLDHLCRVFRNSYWIGEIRNCVCKLEGYVENFVRKIFVK